VDNGDYGVDLEGIARKDGVRGLTSESGSAVRSFEIAPRGVGVAFSQN